MSHALACDNGSLMGAHPAELSEDSASESARAGARRNRVVHRALAPALMAAALLAFYAPVVFGGKAFVLRDALHFTRPSREFLARSLAAGHVPEWWDGVGFGVAFAANPVHGVLSPVTWLLGIWTPGWGCDALTVLQLILVALGTFLAARRLGASPVGACFAGLALASSGYVVSVIANGNVPYLTWIPWLFWAALLHIDAADAGDRRVRGWSAAALAGFFALQLLAGEPGHTLVAGLLLLIVFLTAGHPIRSLRTLVGPVVAGAGLSAVGVLPAVLLLSGSARGGYPSTDPMKFSMHPARLIECVWPLPFGSEGNESWFIRPALHLKPADPAFAFSLYLGLPVLILAVVAARDRRIRRLLIASFLFLVLAFGSYTPVFGILREILPPLRWINYPEKFFSGFVFLWCVSAGVGLSRVVRPPLARRWPLAAAAVGAAILGASATAVHWNRAALQAAIVSRAAGINGRDALTVSVTGAGLAALGAGIFAVAIAFARRSVVVPALVLIYTGTSVPLLYAAKSVTPLASRTFVEQTPRLIAGLPRPPLAQPDTRSRLFLYPWPRIRPALTTGDEIASDIEESLGTNVVSRFGYNVIPGFETGDSARSRRFWEEISPRMSYPAFVRLLGVDFVAVPDPDIFAPGSPVIARSHGLSIVGTFPVRPRAFVAPRAMVVASADEGLHSLALPGREGDPRWIAVAGAGAEAVREPGPLEPCRVSSARPEEVILTCRSSGGGYAVLLDENLPGWSAELNGRRTPILSADGLFRAVRIGGGDHRILFRYRTPGLRLGALVSVLTLAVLVGIGAYRPSERSVP